MNVSPFQTTEEEETIPNAFYKASISKASKDTTGKLQPNIRDNSFPDGASGKRTHLPMKETLETQF